MSGAGGGAPPFAAPLLGVLVLAPLLLAGCGRKDDPRPPVRFVPRAAQDLRVSQQGRELVVQVAYPSETTGGQPLPDLDRVELWRLVRPLPPGAASPRPVDPRELAGLAERELTLTGRDLAESVFGDRLIFRLPLPEIDPQTPRAFYYTVRSAVSERDVSADSNQAVIVPTAPPVPPADLSATATAEGIEVSWSPPVGGETPPVGYHVYRRDPRTRDWGDPLASVGPEDLSWFDRGARFGESYLYAVTTLAARDPLIESAPGGAQEVHYRDRFAPAPPRNLVALAEGGRVRLVWEASPAADVAGYHVYRRGGEEEAFRRLTAEPAPGLEHLDRDLPSGATFTYRVTAIDGEGNEGEPGDEATAAVR